MLIDYPQSLKIVDILGQGNLNMVSEKSGKSQGILLSIICGNPEPIFVSLAEYSHEKHIISDAKGSFLNYCLWRNI